MEIKQMTFEELNPEIFTIIMDDMTEKCGSVELNSKKFAFALVEDGEICGGITGSLDFEKMFINCLGVNKKARGRDYGIKLMEALEAKAVEEGVKLMTVSTLDFQALGFYQKMGYKIWGTLEDCPYVGRTEYHLYKKL